MSRAVAIHFGYGVSDEVIEEIADVCVMVAALKLDAGTWLEHGTPISFCDDCNRQITGEVHVVGDEKYDFCSDCLTAANAHTDRGGNDGR